MSVKKKKKFGLWIINMTNIRIFYKISSECKIQFFRLISSQFGEIFHLITDMIFKIGNLESVFSHQIFPMLPPFQQIFPNVTKCCHLFNFVYSQLFNNLTTSISIHWHALTLSDPQMTLNWIFPKIWSSSMVLSYSKTVSCNIQSKSNGLWMIE